MRRMTRLILIVMVAVGCGQPRPETDEDVPRGPVLEIVAESPRQWTGVAVTPAGRIFANFPRWSAEVPVSVAEVLPGGTIRPYPDEAWNSWSPEADGARTFVCVQSVVGDGEGSLWVLDPASPRLQGVVPGAAKLVQIDTGTDEVVTVIRFDDDVAPASSYLNDVRIDHEHHAAYITDSGAGALIVIDLETGAIRRVLDDHPSTSAEDTVLVFGGHEWRNPDGSAAKVHADGIAFDAAHDLVYFQALTGRTLYRVSGAALRDPMLDASSLGAVVETVAHSGPSDGLLWDGDDGVFISAIEEDAIKRWTPSGGLETVIADPMIAWPDSFAHGPKGALYVTTSQIHLGPSPPDPYRILRITLP